MRKETSLPSFLALPRVLNKVLHGGGGGGGGARPGRQPFTLFYPFFDRKGTLFVYLPLTNDTTCTYVLLNAPPLLTAVNAVSLRYEKEKKRKQSTLFFTALSSSISPFRSIYRRKDKFPGLLYTSTSEVPTPFWRRLPV